MDNTVDLSKPLAIQLFYTIDKLNTSQAEFEKVHAEYTKLENIARKQLKMRLSAQPSDIASDKMETKSICSSSSKCKAKRSSSITSKPSDTIRSRQSRKLESKGSETLKTLSKTSQSKDSCEHIINTELVKRITQYHQNMNNLGSLSVKPIPEKVRFLSHLQRLNATIWRTQKNKYPTLQKLEKLLK